MFFIAFPILMNELIQDLHDIDFKDTSINTSPLAQRGAIKNDFVQFRLLPRKKFLSPNAAVHPG